MAGEYNINLFDGTLLATVYPKETDGPNNVSTPRPIYVVDDVGDAFTIQSVDLTYRFVPGFTFTVALSGGAVNDGTFTVVGGGSTFTGGNTVIPVVENVNPNPPMTTLGQITYSIPATTVMSMPGRETLNYGEIQNEDFIHLMENFAETTANRPSIALSLEGMLFWSKDEQIMYRRGTAAWTSTINLASGDEVLGLPAIPSATGAASKEYVDGKISSASIDDLSDVDTSTTAPAIGEVLKWDGANWIPGVDTAGAGAPSYEEFIAGPAQTIFNTTIPTASNVSGGGAKLIVFVNGIYQMEGAGKAYVVSGINQITFNAAVPAIADVVLYGV